MTRHSALRLPFSMRLDDRMGCANLMDLLQALQKRIQTNIVNIITYMFFLCTHTDNVCELETWRACCWENTNPVNSINVVSLDQLSDY
jgi:hypothetical protein